MTAKVMQVITHLAVGGAENVAMAVMRGLRDAFEFSVFLPCGVEDSAVGTAMQAELTALGIPAHCGTRKPIKRGGLALAAARMIAAVRRVEPDVLHIHTEIPEATYAAAALVWPGLRRIPLAQTIHNSVYWTPRRRFGRWCARALREASVVAVSNGARDAYQALQRDAGLARPLPPLIANGITPPRSRGDRNPGGVVRALFAGRFEPQKGADLLAVAVRESRLPAGVLVELDIIGSGALEPELHVLAERPPPRWTIRVSPPVPGLADKLADYDVVLMPSRFEGLSILAMEAAMAGVTVIATDAPGLREGFPPGYPWLAPAGDGAAFGHMVADVLARPGEWGRIAHGAQQFAIRHFSSETMCSAYGELYARLADGRWNAEWTQQSPATK
ncbi:MAG: glycosyltransferase family 4 protein [Deltaproteobacteria bacterium]|nr:glycosyltransferase family 4 protein [Deltaproteobacteria bacterium]